MTGAITKTWTCEYRRITRLASHTVSIPATPGDATTFLAELLDHEPPTPAPSADGAAQADGTVVLGPWLERHTPDGGGTCRSGGTARPGASLHAITGDRAALARAPVLRAHAATIAKARVERATVATTEPHEEVDIPADAWAPTGATLRYVEHITDRTGQALPVPDPLGLTSVKRVYVETLVPHFAVVDVTSLRCDVDGALETALANTDELAACWEGATDCYVSSFGRAGEDPWDETRVPAPLSRRVVLKRDQPG